MGLVLPSIGGEPGGPMWPPLRRDYKPSGTGGSGTRPYGVIRTGHVGSAKPGAKVEPHRPQFSTQTGRRKRPPNAKPSEAGLRWRGGAME